jgi:DedD protein
MEVDGKEFLRNVALEQEQEKLRKEQEKLRSLRKDSVYKEQQENNPTPNDDSAYLDLSLGGTQSNPQPKQAQYNENIEDIMLEPEDPNKQKKKYILLGLALILVFVITILVIRVVSNTETEQEAQTVKNEDQQELMADKILNKIDSNEEFQKAKEKKSTKAQMDQLEAQQKQQATLDVPEETVKQDSPLLIEDPAEQEPVRDPLGLDATPEPKQVQKPQPPKNEVATKKEQVVVENKVTPKKVEAVKKTPTPTKQSTGKVQGFYVQVGAFTKQPAKSLLDQISKLGYNFAVHPVNIKGTTYNKVIIGPYPTRNRAKVDLPDIKQKMNKPGAFILSF